MKYTCKGALSSASKLLTASMLSIILVACGGGTSGDGTTDDGTLDSGSLDAVGTSDADGGGFDELGLDESGSVDAGAGEDGFIHGGGTLDTDGNGISDENELLACKGFPGVDNNSSNADWNDNCEMRAYIDPAGTVRTPFYNSTYAEGIQRVLLCSGVAGTSSHASFSDGFFGPGTAQAVRDFQNAENEDVLQRQSQGSVESREILVVDGIVGPKTWARLQSRVESAFITNETLQFVEYDVHGVAIPTYGTAVTGINTDVSCADERNFYGSVNDATALVDGWALADTPGSSVIKDFSTGL